jgi:hypothetical protein
MKLTIKAVRETAENAGKNLVYNRSTGEYQITHGFTASAGELPFRDENGKLQLNQAQLQTLKSYV